MPPVPRGPCHLAVTGFAASHILAQPWPGGSRGPEKRRHQPRSHGRGPGARPTRVSRAPPPMPAARALSKAGSCSFQTPCGRRCWHPEPERRRWLCSGARGGRPGQLLRARPPGADGSGARVSGVRLPPPQRRRTRHSPDRATAPPYMLVFTWGPPTFWSPDSGARATAVPAPPLAGNTTLCQGRGPCECGFPVHAMGVADPVGRGRMTGGSGCEWPGGLANSGCGCWLCSQPLLSDLKWMCASFTLTHWVCPGCY